jgi:hypothetical protein
MMNANTDTNTDTDTNMSTKSLLRILLAPWLILWIPATAMLIKAEGWAWNPGDFVVAWVFMSGVGLAYTLVTRKAVNRAYRVATGVALAAGLILLWINGAVGLIGSENNPANLMYVAVLGIGVIGAVIARLKPLGMARALCVTAVAQFVVPVIALMAWRSDFKPGVAKVFALNFAFVVMFAASASLFRRAGRDCRGAGV